MAQSLRTTPSADSLVILVLTQSEAEGLLGAANAAVQSDVSPYIPSKSKQLAMFRALDTLRKAVKKRS